LTELCEITKEACEAVAPMLNGETITLSLIIELLRILFVIFEYSHRFITSFRAILSD
jgi:hypothetical protein